MTGEDSVLMAVDGNVATITLNRPERMNAFSGVMGAALEDAYRRCDADDSIRAVVLTGAGRAFCAGADFSSGSAVFSAPSDTASFRSDPFDFHAWDVRKPVIAAINGHAVGLGLTLALQCDIRLIDADAKCGIVQNRRGVVPDLRSHWTLPRLVGHARATELLLTGRMFNGLEAAEWGIAIDALPADEVLQAGQELARDIALNTAPLSVGLSKRLLWLDGATSDEVDRYEREIHLHVMRRPDAVEGVAAFLDKRSPDWSGSVSEEWPDLGL